MSGPYLQLRSGARYDLLSPDPASILLQDAAHAIAHLARFTGHAREPYSVAQHTVIGVRMLAHEGHSEGVQKAFLVHDLHESVTGDVATPIKVALRCLYETGLDLDGRARPYPNDPWAVFEGIHVQAFASRFGTPREQPKASKDMDARMLATERRDLLEREATPGTWGPMRAEPIEGLRITRCWSPAEAKGYFLDECARLGVR